jgi:hypothetical protein
MAAVDLFSKKVYLVAMVNREANEVLEAFKIIYKEVGNTLKTVRSDNEFTNQKYEDFLKRKNIRSVLGAPRLESTNQRMTVGRIKTYVKSTELYDYDFVLADDGSNRREGDNLTAECGFIAQEVLTTAEENQL